MYDHVLCEVPLPDGYEGSFQTKDFSNLLETYIIKPDGLYQRKVTPALERAHYTGVLNFYDLTEDNRWYEYIAEFKDGALLFIKKVEEGGNAAH